MKRSGRCWSSVAACLLLAAVGCVTRGRYDAAVSERDTLQQRVDRLEASQESLDKERVRLIAQLDDLHQTRDKLDLDVKRLREKEANLSVQLAQQQEELAARGSEIEKLRSTYEGLVKDLEKEVASGQIEITQLREGLQLNLAQEILFPSGSAEVSPAGEAVLAKVAERVRSLPHAVVVEGHTDNVPIHSARYPTNWELAGARASRVVRILADHGVDPSRLSAVSVGEYQPRAPNDTPEGRAKNRRIEITLKPVEGPVEPAAAAPAAGPAAGGGAAAP
jgi:chemotaxis protein MotB